ncbi:MAG: hypothetical protein ACRDQX_03140 [Pseudonocardiaceae bacterium]
MGWSEKVSVEVGGAGTVAQAGVVLPRLLADRLGLCTGLAEVMARSGFFPSRHGQLPVVKVAGADLTRPAAAESTRRPVVRALRTRRADPRPAPDVPADNIVHAAEGVVAYLKHFWLSFACFD